MNETACLMLESTTAHLMISSVVNLDTEMLAGGYERTR